MMLRSIWFLSAFVAVACSRPDSAAERQDSASAAVPAATPATVARADFLQMRWLEGQWRGFMPDGNTFYERYRIVNDSTMVRHSFPDSTFGTPSDSAVIALRDGVVASESENRRYVATRVDSTGADFAPGPGARNHFTWARESPTRWNATLRWTDAEGRPQSVVYALHRFGR